MKRNETNIKILKKTGKCSNQLICRLLYVRSAYVLERLGNPRILTYFYDVDEFYVFRREHFVTLFS